MGVIRKLEHIPVMQVRDQSDIFSINPYQHQTGHGAMVIPDFPYFVPSPCIVQNSNKTVHTNNADKRKKDIWAYST